MPRKEKPCIGKTFVVGNVTVTVEDVIAEGGFALVFLARDNNGRRYALKRMYVNTEKDLAMCQQEVHILDFLAKEKDSYAVRYWASAINIVDEEVKEVLILLDYYKASVLQLMNERFQTKRQLTEEEVVNIFCDVCHAVGKLHNQRPVWIHRDLKVENILIDRDGRCVLCDFGSATNRVFDPTKHSIVEIEEDLKKYTTIAYRSPEMVNLYGIKKPVTAKADIWALGVMLYKMCYFTLPFGESSLAIQNCNLQFPNQPAYSKQLQGLIRYCLKVDPEERPDIVQLASLACWLANRDCGVVNRNKLPIPNPDILLNQPEQVPISTPAESSPPRLIRQPPPPSHDFSSTTSIAPRERPKASTPSAGTLVLPPPPSKFGATPLTPVAVPLNFGTEPALAAGTPLNNPVLIDIASTDTAQQRTNFRPASLASNPFRNGDVIHEVLRGRTEETGQRNLRMGHRRNTSDTSMIPVARPLSPTPTQNVSEKSRSADTSPVRSPGGRNDVDRKFAGWNPFEDAAETWNNVAKAPSLTQSITSLVRKGSVSSISRTTVASPAENGEKAKAKTAEKKEKKKFKYQKFDNDSDEEEGGSASDQLLSHSDAESRRPKQRADSSIPAEEKGTGKDKDTDSIGSASDLKHEDDTTDDEHLSSHRSAVPETEIKVGEEEEEEHYDTVQYGTLEETVSAIQSIASHRTLAHENSTKPLLDDNNGLDKSDEDELDRRIPAPQPSQRRLTFEGIFDQIPFRQPRKSLRDALIPPRKEALLVQTPGTPPGSQVFPKTNPFADCYSGGTRNLPVEKPEINVEPVGPVPIIAPPPVPPKPSFLKRDVILPAATPGNSYSPGYSTDSGEDLFGSSPFDSLTESLVLDEKPTPLVSSGGPKKKSRSPVFQEPAVLHSSNIVTPASPKLSKSPTRSTKSKKFQKKEGISNISFEDA